MRLLPVRPDHGRGRPAQSQSEAVAGADRRAHEHEYLPVWDLPAHRARGRGRARRRGGLNMNKPLRKTDFTRRQLMIGAAGLSFAFLTRPAGAAVAASERAGQAISPWISIATDGTITIMSAATEMGQGS